MEFKWKSLLSTTNFRTWTWISCLDKFVCLTENLRITDSSKQKPQPARQLRPTDYSGTCLRRLCSGLVCVLTRITNAPLCSCCWVSLSLERILTACLPSSAQCSFRVCCFQSKHWLPLIWMSDKCISSHHHSPPSATHSSLTATTHPACLPLLSLECTTTTGPNY